MNLKYSSIFLFIAASLFGSSALAADQNVDISTSETNKINFTGEIVESSCNVNINGGVGPTEINLGKHASSNFAVVGDKSRPVVFTISLVNCKDDDANNYSVDFNATRDSNNANLIAVTGGAEGVGIGISHAGDITKPISIMGKFDDPNNEIKDGKIALQAYYEKSSTGKIIAGAANADAIVTINMN